MNIHRKRMKEMNETNAVNTEHGNGNDVAK